MKCLIEVCPKISEDGVIVNMNYPLTFLEFFETILGLIFRALELEFKNEEKIVRNIIIAQKSRSMKRQHSITAKSRQSSTKSLTLGEKQSVSKSEKIKSKSKIKKSSVQIN